MPTYTPSFNTPITKNLKVTDSLILSPSATGPFSMFTATNSFTAQPNTSYNWTVDTASQSITLPLTPINGAYVVITDIDYSWGNNSPSIDYNGASSKGAAGSSTDLSAFVGGELKFIYSSATNEWTSWQKPATSDNPFQGWWKLVSKTELSSGISVNQYYMGDPLPSGYILDNYLLNDESYKLATYCYIDCISNYPQIKVTTYGGTYNEVFEALKTESMFETLNDDPNNISIGCAGIYGTSSWNYFNYAEFADLPVAIPPVLTLQSSNSNILFGMQGNFTDPSFIFNVRPNSEYSEVFEKMSEAPAIRPWNNNEVGFPDTQDPVYMFNYYINSLNEKGMYGNVPLNGQTDEWYPGYYNEQKIKNEYLQGKTEQYSIHHIIKSTTSQYQPSMDGNLGNATGATKIYLGNNHIITKGSTITISGFSGEWSVLNGTYDNDVIFDAHWNTQSTGHFDCDPANLTGSFYNTTNFFVLRLDTSSLSSIETGSYKGWASYTGTPTVSVTHHITSDMSYNNYIAAIKAYMLEVHGSLSPLPSTYYVSNNSSSGRVANNWDTSSLTQRTSNNSSFGVGRAFGPSLFYSNFGTIFANPVWPRVYADHYDVSSYFTTYITGANVSGWSIPALNYLDPNETYNIYYAFDGEYSTGPVGSFDYDVGQIQEYLGTNYSFQVNLSNPNILGGNKIVCTGAKYYGYTGADIDKTIWSIAGTSTLYFENEQRFYNNNIYGLVRSELTNGKTIGYLYAAQLELYYGLTLSSSINQFWNLFADKEILQNAPDKTLNGQYALMLVPVMKYFNSKGVDGIIVDNRNIDTSADYFINTLEQFFGGDRLKISNDYFYLNTKNQLSPLLNVKDYEYYLNLNQTGADNYLHPSFLESPQGHGTGAVYHGSESTGARVVLLHSESNTYESLTRPWGMAGDNLDRDIGANTKVKLLGSSKGYYNSSRIAGVNLIPYPYIQDTLRGTSTVGSGITDPTMGAPFIKLSTGDGDITLTAMNEINEITAVDAMTSLTGAFTNTFGSAFPMDMETRVYPDFGFVENTRPRLPGDVRPQQPDPTVSGTWRDSWLEASIAEITLGTW